MPSLSHQDDDPFLITSELEIRSILRSIQRNASLLRMFKRGNTELSIMTTILELDDDEQRVIVDSSADPALNDRLIQEAVVVFDTQVDHVNINFMAEGLEACTHDGLPALSAPYPTALRRVQRREFYRVDIPLAEPATCLVAVQQPGKALRVEVRMKDISAGGVALLDVDGVLPHQSGTTFRDVKISLPEVGDLTTDLVVLRVHKQELPNKKEIMELGCRFSNISKQDSAQVQTYIGRLERRLNAKRRGF